MIIALIPKILSVFRVAIFNRFFARFFLRKLVKQTDNLLDDNGLEAVLSALDNEPERAMKFSMAFVDELEKIIKEEKKD